MGERKKESNVTARESERENLIGSTAAAIPALWKLRGIGNNNLCSSSFFARARCITDKSARF